jgi:hypothetical protein
LCVGLPRGPFFAPSFLTSCVTPPFESFTNSIAIWLRLDRNTVSDPATKRRSSGLALSSICSCAPATLTTASRPEGN